MLVTDWPAILENKSWWMYPQGGGELRKSVYHALCCYLHVFFLSC
jgi:hypothetical protein